MKRRSLYEQLVEQLQKKLDATPGPRSCSWCGAPAAGAACPSHEDLDGLLAECWDGSADDVRQVGYTDSRPMANVQLILRNVPAPIKQRLAADAIERDVTMTEIVVGVLVDEFGGDWKPSGRPTLAVGDSPDIVLRIPEETRRALNVRAAETSSTSRSITLGLLAARYGLSGAAVRDSEPQRRRRRHDDARTG